MLIGYEAGPAAGGALSNKLYVHNGPTATPLILGDFAAEEVQLNVTKLGFYGVTPVARHAAIAEPAETLASLKIAVNALREVVKNVGLIS